MSDKPYSLDIEKAVLSAILIDNKTYFKIDNLLDINCFYFELHQKIFTVIKKYLLTDRLANSLTLINPIQDLYKGRDINIKEYLADLEKDFSAFACLDKFVEHLHSLAIRRQVITFASKLATVAQNDYTDDIYVILENAESDFFKLFQSKNTNKLKTLDETILEATKLVTANFHNKTIIDGLSCGFDQIDSLTGGFQNSDLIIIAGRPSMGKTALAVNMAMNVVKDNKSVLLFSLEMSAAQISSRILAMESCVNAFKMRSGAITNDEFNNILATGKRLAAYKLFIDDSAALTLSALKTQIRRMVMKEKISIVFIDYLQLIYSRSSGRKFDSRVQEISEITKGLKDIAKEVNVPIVALSQLSRQVEQREDKKPQLSDLRESGSIEQDADVVMFVYREAYYLMRKQPTEELRYRLDQIKNQAEVIISKQRNGPVGNSCLYFDPNLTLFKNIPE